MPYGKNRCVKLCSVTSYSAVGDELSINQQYSTSRKRKRKSADLYMRLLQKVVTSIVHGESVEKRRKWEICEFGR